MARYQDTLSTLNMYGRTFTCASDFPHVTNLDCNIRQRANVVNVITLPITSNGGRDFRIFLITQLTLNIYYINKYCSYYVAY
jgi:hypothetical protein